MPTKPPVVSSTAIPGGEFDFASAPNICAKLRIDRAGKPKIQQSFAALSKLDTRLFILPTLVVDTGPTLNATYALDGPNSVSLSQLLTDYDDRVQRLSLAVSCLKFVADAWLQTFDSPELRLVPVCPTLIYGLRGRPVPWRIIPVPTVGLSVGDWADADPLCWTGLSGSVLLGRSESADTSVLGWLFHYLFYGEQTDGVPNRSRRFRRVLTGRTFSPAGIEADVNRALPSSFEQEASLMSEVLSELFASRSGTREAWTRAHERLRALAEQLSLERVISRWRYEEKPDIADRMQKLSEDMFGSAPKVKTAPPPTPPVEGEVNDSVVAQLEYLLQRIQEDGIAGVRRYLSRVNYFARGGVDPSVIRLALETIVNLDQQANSSILDESARLQIAYTHARYLGADESSLRAFLNFQFESSWNSAVALALRARLLSGTDQYEHVSQICKRGLELVRSMADGGGHAGLYLTAYFHLLDGIANIGGAAKFRNFAFYGKAFDALRTTWAEAQDLGALDLSDLSIRWMSQLVRSTRLLMNTEWAVIHIGLEAFLRTQRVFADVIASAGVPPLPWFDESRILPE